MSMTINVAEHDVAEAIRRRELCLSAIILFFMGDADEEEIDRVLEDIAGLKDRRVDLFLGRLQELRAAKREG